MRRKALALLLAVVVGLLPSLAFAAGSTTLELPKHRKVLRGMVVVPFNPVSTFEYVSQAPSLMNAQATRSVGTAIVNAVKFVIQNAAAGAVASCAWEPGECVKKVRSVFE